MKEDRMLVDFRTVIEEYEKLEDTIMSLPEYYYVGPICLCSGMIIASLLFISYH